MVLYRPVGLKELELIAQSGFRAFPPRLPGQPIFYPVLSLEYAASIARDWNTKDPNSGYAGFVTRFEIDPPYVERFEVKVVGHAGHQELWIPAEELAEFNRHILGSICVVEAYVGERFAGAIDPATRLPTRLADRGTE